MVYPEHRHPPATTDRARAWDVIRKLGNFTLPQLMGVADICEDNARLLLDALVQSGHLEREDCDPLIRWTVVKDPGAAFLAGRAKRAPRSQAWQSMKIFRTFKLADIVGTADIGEANAYRYIQALEAAGYLRQLGERTRGRRGSHVTWQLIRDTGPEAPVPLADGRVYDANRKETVGRHDQMIVGADRGSARARAWSAIRTLKRFTVAEIQAAARMSEDGTRRYLKALERAGFVHGAKIGRASCRERV